MSTKDEEPTQRELTAPPRQEFTAEPDSDGGVGGQEPKRHVILVVDDEKSIREVVARILQEEGYFVLIADDRTPALDVARTFMGRIDVAVLDFYLSTVTSGGSLAMELQQMYPEIKILFLTGRLLDAEELGHPLLAKPFRYQALVDKVKELLGA